MKTFLKMLTGMTAVFFLSVGELKSENYPMAVEDEIINRPLPVKPTGAPRSLGYDPLFAELQDDILLLGSPCPYGIVEVMLIQRAASRDTSSSNLKI